MARWWGWLLAGLAFGFWQGWLLARLAFGWGSRNVYKRLINGFGFEKCEICRVGGHGVLHRIKNQMNSIFWRETSRKTPKEQLHRCEKPQYKASRPQGRTRRSRCFGLGRPRRRPKEATAGPPNQEGARLAGTRAG